MKTLIRIGIRCYQLFLRPVLVLVAGPNAGCRYQPTCSNFFLQAVDRHGAWRGSWLGIRRILRCHPWGGSGYDPVPPTDSGRDEPPSPPARDRGV